MLELDERDVAAGYPLPAAASCTHRARPAEHPWGARAALAQAVTVPLASGRPVAVAFSGGRDSTLVLCAAVRAAREHGLPDPVPVTQVWPHRAETDESSWQELVVRHLGLADWEKVDMGHDSELLGEHAVGGLRQHGLLWPPTLHTKGRLWGRVRGAHLLTGEGGDQVFGPTRVRALHHWRRAVRHPRAVPQLVRAVAPPPLLGRRPLRAPAAARPWWSAAFADHVARAWRAHEATEPVSARRAIPWVAGDRAIVLGLAAVDRHAARHGVTQHHPLMSPGFVAALARDAGLLGWPDRTRAMTAVAGDLVPTAVLRRTDKVDFTGAAWGPATRRWLAQWDGGSGVDPDLVDAGALRREWSSPRPHPGTALLAHAAWLAQEGRARATTR